MKTTISFKKEEFIKLESFFKKGIKEPAQNAVNRVVGYASNRMGLNAKQIVYAYKPKTERYKRTGNLLGGRGDALAGGLPDLQVGDLKSKITANPQIKGAKTNYAPAVNDGFNGVQNVKPFKRKNRKGGISTVKAHTRRMNIPARPFFDTTIQETEKETPRLVNEVLDQFLNDNLFK
jgi:hypothetical protein